MPMFNPYDSTKHLNMCLPMLKARTDALTGFNLNKTTDGPLVGAIGELIAEEYFKELTSKKFIKAYQYIGGGIGPDFRVEFNDGTQVTIDVKTKRRTYEPQKNFEMSVPKYLYDHEGYSDPNFFLAISVLVEKGALDKFKKAWVIGKISAEDFMKKRYLVKKGARVGGKGGISGLMPTDVYNVKFWALKPPAISKI